MPGSRPLLMIPGPSQPFEEALRAASSILPHYGDDWKNTYEWVVEGLRKIFNTDGEIIIYPAPGFLAIETGIVNLVQPGGKLLMCVNGYFGEVALKIAEAHKRKTVVLEKDYGEAIEPEDVKKILDEERDIDAIYMVYNETSTGVLNPLRSFSKIFKSFEGFVMVDAISIFGGAELRMDDWGVDICVGYSSKALGGLPGISPIAVSRRLWEAVDERKAEQESWYLDFRVWKKSIKEFAAWGHPHPSSMPTHTVIALREVLKKVFEEGLDNVYRRHEIMSAAFRNSVKEMGLKIVADENHPSPTITAIRLPEGVPGKLIRGMIDGFGVMISGGLGKLSGKGVRVGHMGATANRECLSRTVTAMAYTLKQLGFKIDIDGALDAFYRSL